MRAFHTGDMPMLSLPITRSAWEKLEKVAEREGVAVRVLIIYRIRDLVAEGDALASDHSGNGQPGEHPEDDQRVQRQYADQADDGQN
jgi:hypothetical protein